MQSLQNKLFDVVILKALPLAYTSCPELLKYWYFLKTCYPSKVHKCFKTGAVCSNMPCAEFFWHILLKTKPPTINKFWQLQNKNNNSFGQERPFIFKMLKIECMHCLCNGISLKTTITFVWKSLRQMTKQKWLCWFYL